MLNVGWVERGVVQSVLWLCQFGGSMRSLSGCVNLVAQCGRCLGGLCSIAGRCECWNIKKYSLIIINWLYCVFESLYCFSIWKFASYCTLSAV